MGRANERSLLREEGEEENKKKLSQSNCLCTDPVNSQECGREETTLACVFPVLYLFVFPPSLS